MKSKKKSTEEKGPHPFDFSLKKDTKHTKSEAKALKPEVMAAGLLRQHGLEKAKQIVEPLTVDSFKDATGTPVAANEAANYWKHVSSLLKKGSVNVIAG